MTGAILNDYKHKDGIAWYKAPVPWPWHTCHGQTTGFLHGFYIRFCPCGARSLSGGPWIERNTRRRR